MLVKVPCVYLCNQTQHSACMIINSRIPWGSLTLCKVIAYWREWWYLYIQTKIRDKSPFGEKSANQNCKAALISDTDKPALMLFFWCCYTTVDFAMAASQNGFRTFKLPLHNKTNIIENMTKDIRFWLLWSFILEQSWKNIIIQYVTLVELCKHRFVMQPLQKSPLCM